MSVKTPELENIAKSIEPIPAHTPIVMLNMLRFRGKAVYKEGESDISGAEAYAKYRKGASQLLAKAGGVVIWFGTTQALLIAPPEEHWDQIFLVRYPSKEAFFEMISSDEYQRVVKHRQAALSDSRLIANIEPQRS